MQSCSDWAAGDWALETLQGSNGSELYLDDSPAEAPCPVGPKLLTPSLHSLDVGPVRHKPHHMGSTALTINKWTIQSGSAQTSKFLIPKNSSWQCIYLNDLHLEERPAWECGLLYLDQREEWSWSWWCSIIRTQKACKQHIDEPCIASAVQ